ncbi:MAG: epimerase [Stygiobacter sp. RIFOXYC12_FULL_38_8]|nr:MAG: epimerase [Stygiobacter sp. GWC2_38_9]OGU84795.1 MAG: epimerase [Stygiobacter sp. RIFOXYA12_FULL_38_9]OGV08155.1 MAG: epimerase [Stygiobacter sp. RIFOXYB2_FULL_37_11]OGV11264.1 MAG: epimerase [Stygiobacter sp. RIFOXYA2_FULL_38_8]OGV15671.1 MAG: epimerase [Stygiobacter sp. RIFOXYC2_FULL_38_25]OGV22492.1 MAG: epimerase [Stygiobacter sp. RIFOXYC12_FULL_38_8]OGV80785.1 MAG: epimerase [Stygiobacter sp. GWF2_38_21]RJQ64601.1 MAG: epimerase [Stygiobacter sp.]
MKIKAIIFGVTGMVGEGVLLQALNHPDVESVLVVGRRACGITHSKLKEIIHNDFYNFQAIEEQLTGYNACFFCLGVSSIGMNETDYTRVTYDLTMSAAEALSKLNSEMTFCYVSGQGTDSSESGKLMWARVKGKTENDLAKLPFKAVYLFRPGFIKPSKNQKRAYKASMVIGIIYPILKVLLPKYVCTMDDLGMAMINVVKFGYKNRVLENRDIPQVAS